MSSKPTLYVFAGAVWPSAAWLAVYVLGYEDKINLQQLNLIEGNNFNPDFLKLNPKATLPTLVLPNETLKDTKSSVAYLIANASSPVGKPSGTDFVDRIHADAVDPNVALLATRNNEELAAKAAGIPGTFVANRQAQLGKFAPTAPEFATFYAEKIKSNGFLNDIYQGRASAEAKATWFKISTDTWVAIKAFALNDVVDILPESGYIGGEYPGEDDFHLAAWLARIGLLTGGTPDASGALTLEKELGTVPPKIVSYWKLWSETNAWKQVYINGLH